MRQLIASILFGISIIGMAFLLAKTKGEGVRKQEGEKVSVSRLKEKHKIPQKIPFQFDNLLKKFLIRLKIFLLRCENKIDAWLREASHSKKFNDDYWERFKK